MPPAKHYEVIVRFGRRDPKTGNETWYEPGEPYSGPDIDKYLAGVDGQGPLIRETTPSPTQADSSNKEH